MYLSVCVAFANRYEYNKKNQLFVADKLFVLFFVLLQASNVSSERVKARKGLHICVYMYVCVGIRVCVCVCV